MRKLFVQSLTIPHYRSKYKVVIIVLLELQCFRFRSYRQHQTVGPSLYFSPVSRGKLDSQRLKALVDRVGPNGEMAVKNYENNDRHTPRKSDHPRDSWAKEAVSQV